VRTTETIDNELRILAAVRAAIVPLGGLPTILLLDELLDKRGATHLEIETPG
jgi:hypothetical protein